MVLGIPKLSEPGKVCESCIIGKQPRLSFNHHLPMRATFVLHVIHSDVYGPMWRKPLFRLFC